MYSLIRSIFGKPLSELTEPDLEKLIGRHEDKTLEFKSQTYGKESSHKAEFCADVSAFANTAGGLIVIGITESKGEAVEAGGITVENCDKETLRLEQILQTGLSPNIWGITIHSVNLSDGKYVILIEIPKSYNAPHRVEVNDSNRFYLRNSAGKYQPDVGELRQAFTGLEVIHQKIKDFRYERIAKIMVGETPHPLTDATSGIVLHIIPYSSFTKFDSLDMQLIRNNFQEFRPMGTPQGNGGCWPNFEGVLTYPASRPYPQPLSAYTQIWRRGMIEAVRAEAVHNDRGAPYVGMKYVENDLMDGVTQYMLALKKVDILPPFIVFATLVGVKNARLWRGTHPIDPAYPNRFDRDCIYASEIIIEDFLDENELTKVMQPALDEIAHAAGFWES